MTQLGGHVINTLIFSAIRAAYSPVVGIANVVGLCCELSSRRETPKSTSFACIAPVVEAMSTLVGLSSLSSRICALMASRMRSIVCARELLSTKGIGVSRSPVA